MKYRPPLMMHPPPLMMHLSCYAMQLKRTVEMYQWKEESKESKDNVGGGKTTK